METSGPSKSKGGFTLPNVDYYSAEIYLRLYILQFKCRDNIPPVNIPLVHIPELDVLLANGRKSDLSRSLFS